MRFKILHCGADDCFLVLFCETIVERQAYKPVAFAGGEAVFSVETSELKPCRRRVQGNDQLHDPAVSRNRITSVGIHFDKEKTERFKQICKKESFGSMSLS
jgi:hypothetical protein